MARRIFHWVTRCALVQASPSTGTPASLSGGSSIELSSLTGIDSWPVFDIACRGLNEPERQLNLPGCQILALKI